MVFAPFASAQCRLRDENSENTGARESPKPSIVLSFLYRRAIFPPVQVICTFLNALVCWVLQYATTPRMSLKDRVHAQL